ncbi:MAG: hypothetical protein DRO99_02980 [Candidatus Aenigmatarchaeota archaeon]|nr:MAG: hypothetical protein DRO99_02980 [Candidatus Aenigmarchaeota archaeon]
MVDAAGMVATVSELLANLPSIMQGIQVVSYIFLVLFFGSIAVIGYRAYAPFWKRLALRIVFGFFSLFAAVSLVKHMPLFKDGIFKIMQLDMLATGVLASVVFAAGLVLLSRYIPSAPGIKKQINKLEERLQREQSRGEPKSMILNPFTIAGVVVILGLIGFSAMSFRGFPNFQQEVLSEFGITPEDLQMISSAMGGISSDGLDGLIPGDSISDDCGTVANLIIKHQDQLSSIISNGDYANPTIRDSIEQETGETVSSLKFGDIEGTRVVIGMTDGGTMCISTEQEVCFCQKVGTAAQ